jgi:alpha-maltose-1-phosphate synthase
MKIGLLTNEYPPSIYGGAGVHIDYLSRALASLPKHAVEVLCFGDQQTATPNLRARGVPAQTAFASQDARAAKLLEPLYRNLQMTGMLQDIDLVHCHTWYTHLAGCLMRELLNVPLVLTTHSLEPHRPWKREQLGNGYRVSSWIEETAYKNADGVVAVSESMRRDVMELYGVSTEKVRVIPNGIDIDEFQRKRDEDLLRRHGVDPSRPVVLFVGRITRQKGVLHLLNAAPHLPSGTQLVLCAGAPDTPEIGAEMEQKVKALQANPGHHGHKGAQVIWIPKMLSKPELIGFYSAADLFICPSVYEPFGIINLEAMACRVPVVASKVGGIPEVVNHGETGLLVPFAARGPLDFEPKDPEGFSISLADAATNLLADAALRERMASAARARVEAKFAWSRIAEQTSAFYQELIQNHGR